MMIGSKVSPLIGLLWLAAGCACSAPISKTADFTSDPTWDAFNNRLIPQHGVTVQQNFGWSNTSYAGGGAGEIGGKVTRTLTPAYYAQPIATLTYNNSLTMSGKFALLHSDGSDGVYIGWFNAACQGWRPLNFVGVRLNGDGGYARIYIDCASGTWKADGLTTGLQVSANGAVHTFTLTFDPSANGGNGAITFTLDGGDAKVLYLAAGHRDTGATFNRFGILNLQVPGDSMTAYFDDIVHDGATYNFNTIPSWEGHGNRTTFVDYELGNAQNFGWSDTNFAGGARGEIGGLIWRADPSINAHAYYADPIDPFSLNDPLSASGKIALTLANSDGAVYVGWFNGAKYKDQIRQVGTFPPPDFVGFEIEGPSADGFYFRARYQTANGSSGDSGVSASPPILPDGQPHTWSINYTPAGDGSILLKLDSSQVRLNLAAGHKTEGAVLDRFGIFAMRAGGHAVKLFMDDLHYSAVRSTGPTVLVGLNAEGLLIRAWGRVTFSSPDEGYFYIDDGTSLSDGTGHTGIRVSVADAIISVLSVPSVGEYVDVTGPIGKVLDSNKQVRVIRVREQSDIDVCKSAIQ